MLAAFVLLLCAGLLLWASYKAADKAVTRVYAPYNAGIRQYNAKYPGEHLRLLSLQDVASPYKANGQMFPKQMRAGHPCGSDCIGQQAIQTAKIGPVPVPWAAGLGLALLVMGIPAAIQAGSANPRRNLINLDRDRVRLKTTADTLPIIQGGWLTGWAKWGLMRRDHLKGGGRRELGNLFVFGAPGRGKSSLLKWWLATSDLLNFIAVDLKGDLWRNTAGHRAQLGPVYRLDLTSTSGDAIDPLATDDEARARAVINAFLPTGTGEKSDYFNTLASEIALMFWRTAKQTGQSPTVMMVRAATLPNDELMRLAADLVQQTPADDQNELLRGLKAAFGQAWDDPGTASAERNSVIQSFKGGFAPLNTPEILTTLATTTFDPAELVENRATLYISAPSTEAPYKIPIEVLLSAIIQSINNYVDTERNNKQGEDIVILADEAGILKIPLFADTLAGGRSRGVSMAAFFQTMGQLDQYHRRGWRGLVDTAHHWTWFSSNDPDVSQFLRDRCGVYDKPNPNRDPEERRRRPYVEVFAIDEVTPGWGENEVMSLLDFDRKYMIFGKVINPYTNRKVRRLMGVPAPKLPDLPDTPVIRLPAPADQQATPKPQQRSSARATPAPAAREEKADQPATPSPDKPGPIPSEIDDDNEAF